MRKLNLLVNKIIYPSKFKFANEYKKIDNYTFDEIQKIRIRKLNSLVEHFSNMSFYKEILEADFKAADSIEAISNLPIIDKKIIRQNLDILKTIDKNAVLRSTSGSTGENFKFYIPKQRRAAAAGALHDYLSRIGVVSVHGRTLGIWGGGLHKPGEYNPIVDKLKRFILDIELLPGYGIDEEISIKYLKVINDIKPSLLYGYPTYLDMLAKYGLKNNVKPYTPVAIVSSGEQLTENARNRIENYFETKIYNRYGSVEFGVIAHELSKSDGMYINPLRFIVETDQNSELLITDLDNYTTPFIRYRIGDLGELTQKGNWQVLKHIKGRTNDVIETKSGKIIPSQFFTILSRTAKGTESYQFVQISETEIEMRLKVDSNFSNDGIDIIKKNFTDSFGSEMNLEIKIVDELETTEAGKHKFVIRKG